MKRSVLNKNSGIAMSVDMVDVKYTDYGHNDTWWWIYYGVG